MTDVSTFHRGQKNTYLVIDKSHLYLFFLFIGECRGIGHIGHKTLTLHRATR